MSHYTCLVFTDEDTTVESLLEPFDENAEVPHYISREELIQDRRKSFERYRDTTYAEYLANPNEYLKKYGRNEAHIKYITKEFPERFSWTDDDFYREATKYYEESQIQEDGSVYSTYNPNSKWDWYAYGGRWGDGLKLKPTCERASDYEDPNEAFCDDAVVEDLDIDNMNDFHTYAVLTPDGEWHAPGEMGWFACSSETEDEYDVWSREYKSKFLDSAQPHWHVYLMDLHI